MTTDEALAFLAIHQPMPPDTGLSEELVTRYDEVRRHLAEHPDPRAPGLLLGSFGDGSGFGVYQLVADVLRLHDRDAVVDALGEALRSDVPSVRAWALDVALEYPDDRLDVLVRTGLESASRDDRYFAAAYLADRGLVVPAALVAAARAGGDPELQAALDALRSDAVALLGQSQRLRHDEDFADFDIALGQVAERMEPADLPAVYRVFDDAVDDFGAYWKAVHLIDAFDVATAARAFVDALPEMLPAARHWMRLLAIRQLDQDTARARLVEAGRSARPIGRSALAGLLAELASEPDADGEAPLAAKAAAALAALNGA
jgi:hypothetical protein